MVNEKLSVRRGDGPIDYLTEMLRKKVTPTYALQTVNFQELSSLFAVDLLISAGKDEIVLPSLIVSDNSSG